MKNKFLNLYIGKILLLSMTLPFQVLAFRDASRDHLCFTKWNVEGKPRVANESREVNIHNYICAKRSFLHSIFEHQIVNPLSKKEKKELCSYKPEEITLIGTEYHALPGERHDHCLYLLQPKKDRNKIFRFETKKLGPP